MLDLYGVEYLFEHIRAERYEEQRRELYETYITDSLQTLIIATVKILGQDVQPPRFFDILHDDEEEEEKRSPEEIIQTIRNKLEQMRGD